MLAFELNKSVGEIEKLPYTEYIGWVAFLKMRGD